MQFSLLNVFGKHILCPFLIPSLIFCTASSFRVWNDSFQTECTDRTMAPNANNIRVHRLFISRKGCSVADYPDSLSFNGHPREHSKALESANYSWPLNILARADLFKIETAASSRIQLHRSAHWLWSLPPQFPELCAEHPVDALNLNCKKQKLV